MFSAPDRWCCDRGRRSRFSIGGRFLSVSLPVGRVFHQGVFSGRPSGMLASFPIKLTGTCRGFSREAGSREETAGTCLTYR